MRAPDANVLVRYVAADDEKQLQAADRVLQECARNGESVFLPVLVLCELVWVLDRSYGLSKAEIVRMLDSMSGKDLFEIERHDLVRRSEDAWWDGKGGFGDYVIGAR